MLLVMTQSIRTIERNNDMLGAALYDVQHHTMQSGSFRLATQKQTYQRLNQSLSSERRLMYLCMIFYILLLHV
jgi:hypothetical protein